MDESRFTRQSNDMSWAFTVVFISTFFLMWGASIINIPEIRDIAVIYLFMVIGAVVLALNAYLSSAITGHVIFPFGVYSFPPIKNLALPLLTGITFGFIYSILSGSIAAITQTFDVINPFLALSPILIFLLYGFAAPGAEEALFRSVILPMMLRLGTKSERVIYQNIGFVVAILLNVVCWDIVHYYTFGGSMPFLISAGIFGVGLCILTVIFRTATSAFAAHMTYNTVLIWNYVQPPAIYFWLIILVAAIIVVVCILHKSFKQ